MSGGREGLPALGSIFLLLTLIFGLVSGPRLRAGTPTNSPARRAGVLAQQGRYVYERNCVICHGRYGDGRGEMARGMQPKPRRFTAGVFKYRSTPSGFLPSEADLERTIRNGIAGTSMPSFAGLLTQRDIESVIETVKTFSSKWDHAGNQSRPLTIPTVPDWFEVDADLLRHARSGAAVYQVNCAPCHGTQGRGDGIAAPNLENDWGEPTPPADLTASTLRCGPGSEDIYRTLATGLNGTPMPSFLESTTDSDRWNLTAWILAARRARAARTSSTEGQ